MNKEQEDGYIEYKLHMLNKSRVRLQELTTQMSYRLEEGSGQCIYILGITDDGIPIGLSDKDFSDSLIHLNHIISENNSSIINISSKSVENDKKLYEILIRETIDTKYIDIKVAVAGNVDSGKSTLIGVLVNGKSDNGRGSARLSVFNYIHEVNSGRTSSIAHHILGFNNKGNITNYDDVYKKDWSDIVKKSSKIISFYDLAGHEKYLKTTILGLSSSIPDICFITIGANMGVTKMTKEHIFLCVMLNIPFIILITKIDICVNRQNILNETIDTIKKILKMPGIRKIPYKIKNEDDILTCIKNSSSQAIVPLFLISNVSGEGIDHLKSYLNFVPKRKVNINTYMNDIEYHIDTIFFVTGVGTIVGGHLTSGTIRVGDKLVLGPNQTNGYDPFTVKSIHSKRVLVNEVRASGYVCICLRKAQRKNIRKGQVLLSAHSPNHYSIREFKANVTILKTHSTSIRVGYEPVLHVSTIRQTAKIIHIDNIIYSKTRKDNKESILRTGDKATITFRFKYRNEYIKKGYKIVLAEGRVKLVGIVI